MRSQCICIDNATIHRSQPDHIRRDDMMTSRSQSHQQTRRHADSAADASSPADTLSGQDPGPTSERFSPRFPTGPAPLGAARNSVLPGEPRAR